MAHADVQAYCLVASLAALALLLWRIARLLQRIHLDTLHATIDLHKELGRIRAVLQTALLHNLATPTSQPSPAEAVGDHTHQESPEEWLARMTREHAKRQR